MTAFNRTAILVAKLIALTLVLMMASAFGSSLLPSVGEGEVAADGAATVPDGSFMTVVLGWMFLQTVALAYPIVRSRWHGWRLAVAIAVVFFGTASFLNLIESVVYLGDRMPAGMNAGLMWMGLINAAVFAPLAVAVLGRWRAPAVAEETSRPWPTHLWARLAAGGLIMLGFYYLFGYYVAWQSPELREFYGGTDPGSFVAQMESIARDIPWMLPLQYLRALLWTALGLLVVRSMKGPWWQAGLALALLFTVPAFGLLVPNPMMPEAVRMVHLVETVPYQFLFGWIVAWLLSSRGLRKRRGAEAARGEAAVQAT